MVQIFKEIYLTTFAIFYRMARASWSSNASAGVGVASIALIEGGVLLGIAGWVNILTAEGNLLKGPQWVIGLGYLALCFVNFFVLVVRGSGIRFEGELRTLERSKRRLLIVGSVVATLAAVAFFICSASVHRKHMRSSERENHTWAVSDRGYARL